MQQTTIDDVTTFWEQGPEPLSAALVFRVGARDESFHTVEVTHLVEHLVMATHPKSHLDHNASVDVDSTTFVATGRPEEVAGFLERVCRALSDLPVDRLEREQGVLAAEDGSCAHPALCWAAGIRYGLTGPGLLNTAGAGVRAVTADQTREYAAKHFVRENAVLVLTGPPPEELRLPLPTGSRPPRPAALATGLPTPGFMRATPHPILSMELPGDLWAGTVARILVDRVTDDVRHGRGLAYDIGFDSVRVDDGRTLVAVHTDGQEADADAVAETLWSTLRHLAENGPTPAELDHHLAGFRAYTEDPRASADWMEGIAHRHLHGDPLLDRAQALESLAAVGADDVRRWAQQALPTVVLGTVPTDDGHDEPLGDLQDLTEWLPEPFRPSADVQRFPRKLVSLAPRDLAMDVGADGLSLTVDGTTIGGRWEDVIAMGRADGLRLVHLASGSAILVLARHHRGGQRLLEEVDRRLAPIAYDTTEEQVLEQD